MNYENVSIRASLPRLDTPMSPHTSSPIDVSPTPRSIASIIRSHKWICAKQGHIPRLVCHTEPPFSATVGDLAVTSKLPRMTWKPKRRLHLDTRDTEITEPGSRDTGSSIICDNCGFDIADEDWRSKRGISRPVDKALQSSRNDHLQAQLITAPITYRRDEMHVNLCAETKRAALSALCSTISTKCMSSRAETAILTTTKTGEKIDREAF